MINLNQLDANIAKEVLVTLMYTDEKILDKIPSDLINNLSTLAADSNIDINFEKGKAIDEQGLSDETINIISVLYYYYVATEDEKKELLQNWKYNESIN